MIRAPVPIPYMPERELLAELADWSEVVKQENGDVGDHCWGAIDRLLDELVERHPELRHPAR
jgi:hypothetical protein